MRSTTCCGRDAVPNPCGRMRGSLTSPNAGSQRGIRSGIAALLLGVPAFLVSSPWGVWLAMMAGLLGLISMLRAHADLLQRMLDSWMAKIVIGLIGGAGLLVATTAARWLVSTLTFLDPGMFPTATSVLSYIATIYIWILLSYIVAQLIVLRNVLSLIDRLEIEGVRRIPKHLSRILATAGQYVGWAVFMFALLPMGMNEAAKRSDEVVGRILFTTSFFSFHDEFL